MCETKGWHAHDLEYFHNRPYLDALNRLYQINPKQIIVVNCGLKKDNLNGRLCSNMRKNIPPFANGTGIKYCKLIKGALCPHSIPEISLEEQLAC